MKTKTPIFWGGPQDGKPYPEDIDLALIVTVKDSRYGANNLVYNYTLSDDNTKYIYQGETLDTDGDTEWSSKNGNN